MKKLQLAIDTLEVEAFPMQAEKTESVGTIDAYDVTSNSGGSCFDPTCRHALCITPASDCCVI